MILLPVGGTATAVLKGNDRLDAPAFSPDGERLAYQKMTRDDPVAAIDQNCVGCGNCGEVADAAVLCPSFYRADVIHNPSLLDRAEKKRKEFLTGGTSPAWYGPA